MAPQAKPTTGQQSRLPFAPSSAEKPTSSAPSNPSSASNNAAKPAENDVDSSAQACAPESCVILREEGRCRVTPASDGSHHHGAGVPDFQIPRMPRCHMCQLFVSQIPTSRKLFASQIPTPASDGSHRHGVGETLSEGCNTPVPSRMQVANRRCGGEVLRQGRIGESPRSALGWPRA